MILLYHVFPCKATLKIVRMPPVDWYHAGLTYLHTMLSRIAGIMAYDEGGIVQKDKGDYVYHQPVAMFVLLDDPL